MESSANLDKDGFLDLSILGPMLLENVRANNADSDAYLERESHRNEHATPYPMNSPIPMPPPLTPDGSEKTPADGEGDGGRQAETGGKNINDLLAGVPKADLSAKYQAQLAEQARGITADEPWCLAVQIGEGRWMEVNGMISFVDGHCHKIEFPGFMARSGEGSGLTATFHFIEKAWREGDVEHGNIGQMVMVDGLLMTNETIARDVELIKQSSITAAAAPLENVAGDLTKNTGVDIDLMKIDQQAGKHWLSEHREETKRKLKNTEQGTQPPLKKVRTKTADSFFVGQTVILTGAAPFEVAGQYGDVEEIIASRNVVRLRLRTGSCKGETHEAKPWQLGLVPMENLVDAYDRLERDYSAAKAELDDLKARSNKTEAAAQPRKRGQPMNEQPLQNDEPQPPPHGYPELGLSAEEAAILDECVAEEARYVTEQKAKRTAERAAAKPPAAE
jgi:hypothetical protein